MTLDHIFAAIVTFNPNIERLNQNIKAIIPQVEKVVIFDNGSMRQDSIRSYFEKEFPNILIISSSENKGIAFALNRLFEYADLHGGEYLITLDQDSVCDDSLVASLRNAMNPNSAICAPAIKYRNNEDYSEKGTGVASVDWVITSASLTSVNCWKEIGGFDEYLFIDGVDKDFCFRLLRAGYSITKNYDVKLEHELGNLRCIKVFGRKIFVTHHAPFRYYYMVRNAIYLDKKLGRHDHYAFIAKLILKTLFFEDNRKEKLMSISKGIHDGHKTAPKKLQQISSI